MPSPTSISVDKLSRFVGLPKCPQLFDVRSAERVEPDRGFYLGEGIGGRWENGLAL